MGEGWRVQVCSPLLQGPPPLHYSAVNASNTLSITAPSEFLLSFYILLILRVEGALVTTIVLLQLKLMVNFSFRHFFMSTRNELWNRSNQIFQNGTNNFK